MVHASSLKGLCIGRAVRVNEEELAGKGGAQLFVMFMPCREPMSKLQVGMHFFIVCMPASANARLSDGVNESQPVPVGLCPVVQ